MRRVILPAMLVYALLLAGLLARSGALLALALPFALYLLAGLWRSPHQLGLEASRTLSAERAGPDQPVQVSITVTNTGPTLDEVLLEDRLPPGLVVADGSPRHLFHLPHGQSAHWTYTVRGPRGHYGFASIRAVAVEPFGLVTREESLPAGGQIFVLPPVLRLKSVAIRPRRTRVYSGLVPARTGGPGAEFYGVREYQAGDPPRWINWHASARHPAHLYSSEFEQERVTDIGLVLDARERANLVAGGHSIFEYSALAAAALADAFLSQGNRAGLLVYGQYLNWTVPGYGKMQRERILRALALARPGISQAFADLDHIPTRLFPSHSQIVLVSPLLPDDVPTLLRLRARGYQVLIVNPDPLAFEVATLPATADVGLAARIVRLERGLLLQRLRRAGIQVIVWDVSRPFEQVVHGRLSRPQAWLRAVQVSP